MNPQIDAGLYLGLIERVAGIGTWRVDLIQSILYWSEQIYRIHGVTPETYTPALDSAVGFYHPEDLERVNQALANAIEKKENFEFELRIIRADKAVRWVHSKGECEIDTAGNVCAINGIFQDITDKRDLTQRLTESEQRFSMAIQGSQSGIWDWKDVNADEEWWSPQFYALLGYEDREIPATLENFGLALHPDDTEKTFALVKKHFEGKADFDLEYRLKQKSGDYRWFQGYGVASRDKQGNPIRMVGSITDIHERKIYQERINTFFKLSADLVCIVSGDYFLEINPAFEHMLGYSRNELLASPYVDFIHPDYVAATRDELTNVRERVETREFENQFRHKNGSFVWLSWSATVDSEEGLIYAIGRNVDDTKEKLRLVEEYTAALKQRNKELDDFAHVASHDLKAPLRAIDNLATWVEEDAHAHLPEESKQHLRQLRKRINRMKQLLNDLLQYSRVGRVDSNLEEVHCNEVIDSVLATLMPDSPAVINRPSDPLHVTTNKLALYQVFLNLINNAIKHNDKATPVVDISWERGKDFITFTVKDNGPGIAQEYHERIFAVFQTLKPRDEVEGSGVGLAIVRKLVDSYGGRIHVESSQGDGTSFIFTWPLRRLLT